MNIKSIFFFLGASILLCSCEDFFNSVSDVKIADHESQLVVFCFIDGDEETQIARVGNSKGYTEVGEPDIITNATLTLSKNGILVSEASVNSSGEYIFEGFLDAAANDEFRLDISASGYESIYAVERVPSEVDLVSVEFLGNNFSLDYGEPLPEYEITINDDAAYDNYYAIEVWQIDTLSNYRSHQYLLSNDINITEWWDVGMVVKDEIFNGNTHQLRIFIDKYIDEDNPGLPENHVYEFIVKSISEPTYQYAKSYTTYLINEDNFFAEPSTVTSNMQEVGFGMFSYLRNKRIRVEE